MSCQIIRYRISKEPFEGQRAAVKCLTHNWDAYEFQLGGVINDECPIGRAERLEGVTDAQRTAAVTAFVEAQPDRQAEALAEMVLTVRGLRNDLKALEERLGAIVDTMTRLGIQLGGKP